ncbi:MAG TPA: acetamidase/formamidase family protein [Rubrobacter sp.]
MHSIEPTRETLHGAFSQDLPPVLSIDSGDTVVFSTLESGWGLEPSRESGERRRFEDFRPEWRGDGHALCGPVEVRGAEPGMTLEVRVVDLRTGTWGRTVAGGAYPEELNRRLGVADREELLEWTLDPDALVGRDQYGHSVALCPFMGVMGMPPDEPGLHPTQPPRASGGNIDCKELVPGSSLFLPISVGGALFSVGDGHAAQGDGEVCQTAIECPMQRVELSFRLRRELRLRTPRALTPKGWISFGFHPDLDEAMFIAVEAMIELMEGLLGLDRRRALALASVAVDFHVTQVVNGAKGVHALLPHGAIR